MAEYDDLAQIEKLHVEQAQLDQALTILEDHDGIVTMFTVAAPYLVPDPQNPTPPPLVMPPMPVSIMTIDPGQNLMAAAHAACVQRYNAINQELRDLGVTGGPPDHSQGGGGGPPHEA